MSLIVSCLFTWPTFAILLNFNFYVIGFFGVVLGSFFSLSFHGGEIMTLEFLLSTHAILRFFFLFFFFTSSCMFGSVYKKSFFRLVP